MNHLSKYLNAQEKNYKTALDELKAGSKRSHWMWFIFPQIAGLGVSKTSQFYAFSSLDEAKDYLSDPVLGSRLLKCVALVLQHGERTACEIFGWIDAKKFQSFLTLFEIVDPEEPLFKQALSTFYQDTRDVNTVKLLRINNSL